MADTLRLLFANDRSQKPGGDTEKRGDKLAETKRQERALKEALKEERAASKEKRDQEHHEEAAAAKLERSWNPFSRRAAREARHEARHAAKVAEGQMCEHGVWKCRICFPHKTGK